MKKHVATTRQLLLLLSAEEIDVLICREVFRQPRIHLAPKYSSDAALCAAAEQRLTERGLGPRYSAALRDEQRLAQERWDRVNPDLADLTLPHDFQDVTRSAISRCRAMLAVVRGVDRE